jgi:hypothetical protein
LLASVQLYFIFSIPDDDYPTFISWDCIGNFPFTVGNECKKKILMGNSTGDPATPLSLAKTVFGLLSNPSLLVVKAERHIIYGINKRVDYIVNRFLLTGYVGFKSLCIDGVTGHTLPCSECSTCDIICYNKGTQILTIDGYRSIETLTPGTLIKTYLHGYRPIELIGKGTLKNNPSEWSKCMYRLPLTDFDDLIVTGGHGVLKERLTRSEIDLDRSWFNQHKRYSSIDGLYLQRSAFNHSFKRVDGTDEYHYYHFSLQSDRRWKRYGVWANGVLSESTFSHQVSKNLKLN